MSGAAWRLKILHDTWFEYNSPVYSSYNEARLTPLSDSRQTVIVNRVQTSPPTRNYRYTDYWGTMVTTFDLHAPHTELDVHGSSVVETEDAKRPLRFLEWENIRDDAFVDKYNEMLGFSAYVPRNDQLVQIAQGLVEGKNPFEALQAICKWVHHALLYMPGSTFVHTNAVYAYQAGKGVCQDYAHLTLLMLRSVGIPARYVSGYFHPQREAKIDEPVVGQSHAWIQAFIGEWWGYDPTNDSDINRQYVSVGTGRDYSDVSPLKGIISGGGASAFNVKVEITRLA